MTVPPTMADLRPRATLAQVNALLAAHVRERARAHGWMPVRADAAAGALPDWQGETVARAPGDADPATAAAAALGPLARTLGWGALTVVPLRAGPWLGDRRRDDPAWRSACERLRDVGLGDGFDGVLTLGPQRAGAVLGALMRLVALDAGAPGVAFAPAGARIVGAPCQYGSLHFEAYEAADRTALEAALSRHRWTLHGPLDCGGVAVPGRRLRLPG